MAQRITVIPKIVRNRRFFFTILRPRYDRIYSVTHIFLRIPGMTERKLVLIILCVQIIITAVALLTVQ